LLIAAKIEQVSLHVRVHHANAADRHAQGIPVERGAFIELPVAMATRTNAAAVWKSAGLSLGLLRVATFVGVGGYVVEMFARAVDANGGVSFYSNFGYDICVFIVVVLYVRYTIKRLFVYFQTLLGTILFCFCLEKISKQR
jgi:hypothetical protein